MDPMPEIVPEASPHQEMEYLFSRLFKDLQLDAEQTAAAKEVILRDVNGRRVRDRGSEPTWNRDMALMAQRDVALGSLLRDASQKATFDESASELHRTFESLRLKAGR